MGCSSSADLEEKFLRNLPDEVDSPQKKVHINNNQPEDKDKSKYNNNSNNNLSIKAKHEEYNNNLKDKDISSEIEKENLKIKSLEEDKIEKRENNIPISIKDSNKTKLEELEESIVIGLRNVGATCYMNATLQSFSNTNKLTEYFLKEYKYDPNDNKKIMSNEYYKVVKNLWDIKNNHKSYAPYEFKEKLSKENPLFAGIVANDSKDLINFLLQAFHSELNVIIKNNNYNENDFIVTSNEQLDENKMLDIFKKDLEVNYNSVISKYFHGIIETKCQCLNCKKMKYNFQVISFIEFPLEDINCYCFNKGLRKNIDPKENKNPDVDLYECFDYYNKMELMSGDNQIYCNICNCLSNGLYGTQLYSVPEYLIIILNRGRNARYEFKVNFPEQLDLSNFVTMKDKNSILELYSVICHIGPSSMSGHFVAYCKNRVDKRWYLYNDDFVTLCEYPDDYQNKMPYILFYQTKS